MPRKPTAKDVHMLTIARDKLRTAIVERFSHPLTRSISRLLGKLDASVRTSAESIKDPIDCNHGVPWTKCTICSSPRKP